MPGDLFQGHRSPAFLGHKLRILIRKAQPPYGYPHSSRGTLSKPWYSVPLPTKQGDVLNLAAKKNWLLKKIDRGKRAGLDSLRGWFTLVGYS